MVTKENSKGDKNDYFNIYEEQSSIVSVTDILVTVTKSFFACKVTYVILISDVLARNLNLGNEKQTSFSNSCYNSLLTVLLQLFFTFKCNASILILTSFSFQVGILFEDVR